VWDLEARYLAQAVRALTYAVAPQRFVFGGGVTRQPGLVERIAERVPTELGGYAASPALLQGSTGYVVAAGLGQDAGMLGAIALGLEAARR
jgi:fructokinase